MHIYTRKVVGQIYLPAHLKLYYLQCKSVAEGWSFREPGFIRGICLVYYIDPDGVVFETVEQGFLSEWRVDRFGLLVHDKSGNPVEFKETDLSEHLVHFFA